MTAQLYNNYIPEPLTPREVEVLYLLFDFDLDPTDIAARLSITRSTVKFHTLSIYSKLGVDSRFEAICCYARINPEYRAAFISFLSKIPE